MAYYMLFELEGGKWGPQFGDYDKEAVEYERRDMIEGYQNISARNLKIVRLPSAHQREVDKARAKLNGEEYKTNPSKIEGISRFRDSGSKITKRDLNNYFRILLSHARSGIRDITRKGKKTVVVYGVRVGNSKGRYAVQSYDEAVSIGKKLAASTGQRVVIFDTKAVDVPVREFEPQVRGGRMVVNPTPRLRVASNPRRRRKHGTLTVRIVTGERKQPGDTTNTLAEYKNVTDRRYVNQQVQSLLTYYKQEFPKARIIWS